MSKKKGPTPLQYEQLETGFAELITSFESTASIETLVGMIGQKRAVNAVNFGLEMKKEGYNVFLAGLPGTGKTTYIKNAVGTKAKTESVPEDWVYVHNFDNPDQPVAVNLPAGEGRNFVKNMETLIGEIKTEIKKAFSGEEYERQRNDIFKGIKEKQQKVLTELDKEAKERGFIIQKKSTGIFTIPAKDGQPMKQEDYDKMSPEEKEELSRRSHELQEIIANAMRHIRKMERDAREELVELDKKIGHFAVDDLIDEEKKKYQGNSQVEKYLNAVQADIIENLNDFKDKDEEVSATLSFLTQKGEDTKERYRVNLFIDNYGLEGAPVVFETNPTYTNLTGKVEYTNRMGTMVTNYMMVKPGSLHRANGGYLIINTKDIFSHYQAWEALKRALKNNKVIIENISEYMGVVTISTLKPQPIPLQVKVILMGSLWHYQILYRYDDDFPKLFKIKAEFDTEMEADQENAEKFVSFISSHCHQKELLHFSNAGVLALLEYSARLAGSKKKLSTRFNEIVEVIYEAETIAQKQESKLVEDTHIHQAIEEKIYRSNRIEEKILELIKDNTILLDLEGEKIGQVNGLSVYQLGDYQFGRPTKITAVTYLGKAGIVNIEREVKMSGRIHSKGVLILSAFLGSKYAQQKPLSLSASLTFEQNYEGVDGDSASAAELIALLTSIADVPIKQNIAITGSVNQKGEIQPVGGITEKIEGFYKACKVKGCNHDLGAIIPHQNLENLLLSAEVKEAVRKEKLKIFPIKDVDEGIRILTGMEPGEPDADNNYPENTFNYLVAKRLTEMARELEKKTEGEEKRNNNDEES